MVIKNKELIQSYVLTTARYDYSVYEKRVLYRIVEQLQAFLNGVELKGRYPIQEDLFGDRLMTFEISHFLTGEDDKNHTRIIKALKDLNDKSFEYVTDSSWERIRIIESPKMEGIGKKTTTIQFRLDKKMYNAFLDFTKGHKKFELELAMKFESVYAMRFYELFANQKTPLTYTIPALKEMFGLNDKYNGRTGNTDFIRKVVTKAQIELDKHSPVSFKFKYKDRDLKRQGKIYNILFIPYEIPKNRNIEIEKKTIQKSESLGWDFKPEFIQDLKRDFDFSEIEIKRNRDLLKAGSELVWFKDFYSLVKAKSRVAKNPKGYFITALRNELNSSHE